jgi:integrase
VHGEHKSAWKNDKHSAQWINTLSEYALPIIGDRRVDQIETADVLRVLSPIWLLKPETARRVKQRIRTTLDWAKAAGFRLGENPVDGVSKGLPRQSRLKQHHAALSYAEIPFFIQAIRTRAVSEGVKIAFELLILTATRTSEVLKAKWSEIDLENGVWTVPATRMKAGREHRIPLSPRCFEIFIRAQELAAGSDYVFPGRSGRAPMSNMVFLMVLRRMNLQVTAHGFRSAFRDWAAERTSFPREVCEMALAHTIKDKAEAAYRRGDMLERRRDLMCAWADYATSQPAQVITLRVGEGR